MLLPGLWPEKLASAESDGFIAKKDDDDDTIFTVD